MEIITAFFLKIIDNSLSTVKTVHVAKSSYFIGGLFGAAASVFYYIAIRQVANSNSWESIAAMAFATFLGIWGPGVLIEKRKKDAVYTYQVLAPSFEEGIEFADLVRSKNLTVHTQIVYSHDIQKTINCHIYCKTKEQSNMVDQLIPDHFMFHTYKTIK